MGWLGLRANDGRGMAGEQEHIDAVFILVFINFLLLKNVVDVFKNFWVDGQHDTTFSVGSIDG